MNPRLVATVWVLVTLDCALIGYRLAMGRTARLDKRRYHQIASARGALLGQAPLAAVTALGVLVVVRGGEEVATEFNSAMSRFIAAGGAYAGLILVASAMCSLRSVRVRTVASVVIFGPLTLLRPAVVILTVAFAVGRHPTPGLALVGLTVVIPGVCLEMVLDRRIARRLVLHADGHTH
ncbi:MAG: hypothetical protein M9922_11785 [Microthrixaceae bacterium]|nr:hypothetical protein [Microthrixaceae bacterium]